MIILIILSYINSNGVKISVLSKPLLVPSSLILRDPLEKTISQLAPQGLFSFILRGE